MFKTPSWIQNAYPYVRPAGNYFFTPILIGLNLLMFGLMTAFSPVWWQTLLSADLYSLEQWGGNARSLTLGHQQWWRLLSAGFQHLGLYHLLMNMLALYFAGSILEKVLGRWLFLGVYLYCMICSGAVSLIGHDENIAVGASGAILGLYGIFLIMIAFRIEGLRRERGLWISVIIFIAYNLFNGFFNKIQIIDNAGHIGGLVSGVAAGTLVCFYLKHTKGILKKYILPISGALFVLGAFLLLLPFLKVYQIPRFRSLLNSYSYHEMNALNTFPADSLLNKRSKEDILIMANNSLKQWNECLLNAHKMEQLTLPNRFQEFNRHLLKYTQLQKRKSEWFIYVFENSAEIPQEKMDDINARIDSAGNILSKELSELY